METGNKPKLGVNEHEHLPLFTTTAVKSHRVHK